MRLMALCSVVWLIACGTATEKEEVSTTVPQETVGYIVTSSMAPSERYVRSIEQMVLFYSDAIVRASLTSVTATTETITRDSGTSYRPIHEYKFNVHEYLKGTGQNTILVTVRPRVLFTPEGFEPEVSTWPTDQAAAQSLADGLLNSQDTSSDNKQAILFLWPETFIHYQSAYRMSEVAITADATVSRFVFPLYDTEDIPVWDHLTNSIFRVWLPATNSTGTSFVTDEDSSITLTDFKSRQSAVETKLSANKDTEGYKKCLWSMTSAQARKAAGGQTEYPSDPIAADSGQAKGTEIYSEEKMGHKEYYTLFLRGDDTDLFQFLRLDDNEDPGNGYTQSLQLARPLPSGEYTLRIAMAFATDVLCGFESENVTVQTLTVTAPDGVLHELFFDPVTVGSTVAADSTNGVLKIAGFTGASGAAATIQRIAWEAGAGESGTVEIQVTPDGALAGHVVDFIGLDGTVSLSLNVADATVDAANGTLSWAVSSQPWEDGDKLMLRIREAPATCSTGTAAANPSVNPGLVADCEILLAARDTLRGTGSLNWSVSSAIASWDGVTVGGAPSRVTRLELANDGLDGSIPSEMGRLFGLTRLDLSGNRLTGGIPSELGELTGLQSLSLGDNELTGGIPSELGGLTGLQTLYLANNALTGEIPPQLGELSAMQTLSLNGNQLTGGIPSELGRLTGLRTLHLFGNRLTGEIPAWLGDLTGLQILHLGNNRLTGVAPAQLGELTRLQTLSLANNQLTGGIPSELGNLTSLQTLDLSRNRLTDEIPARLGELSSLLLLSLGNNQLTGGIPSELGGLTGLQTLDLAGNHLTGGIPPGLGGLTGRADRSAAPVSLRQPVDGRYPARTGGTDRPADPVPQRQPVDGRDTGGAGRADRAPYPASGQQPADRLHPRGTAGRREQRPGPSGARLL